MYKNLHNNDIYIAIHLTSTKEIWDRLQLLHGDASSNSAKKEKRKRKDKKPCQKKSVQLNETSICVNVPDPHEEKTNENKARCDLSLASIEIFKNENKDLKKLVHICDEKEHEYKDECIILKTQIEEARRLEEVIGIKFKERDL